MVRKPFLRLELSVPGAIQWQLQRRAVLGRYVELNLFADGRGLDQADGQNDCRAPM